jgi:hypothetical protein
VPCIKGAVAATAMELVKRPLDDDENNALVIKRQKMDPRIPAVSHAGALPPCPATAHRLGRLLSLCWKSSARRRTAESADAHTAIEGSRGASRLQKMDAGSRRRLTRGRAVVGGRSR